MYSKLAVVIMAAGKGTRMKNPEMAKVMFPIGGKPMIHHVIERSQACNPERIVAIIGYKREGVREYLQEAFGRDVDYAEQIEQHGTGHAVMQAVPHLQGFQGDVLILSGDVPLLTTSTISALINEHRAQDAVATILTVLAPDPRGYGRVIRNQDGAVAYNVEHKDATEAERSVNEINSGIYVFRAADLLEALPHLNNDNAQGEYYLPDVFAWFRGEGRKIAAYTSPDFGEIQGINTVEQLEAADRAFAERMEAD